MKTTRTKTKTRPWDAAQHLETEEDMAAYLEAALEEGDASLVAAALEDVAHAKERTRIARETGDPELANQMKVAERVMNEDRDVLEKLAE